ncbi:prephenate dehydrogenase [Lutimonas halocynthiae]|uniref:prephenate dehydrogenase n=1 Tax=Lutimonas halocynthiae TaxID=1446477 RepID=UPI0025B453A1|nr:prephenate dehydrogenase [Lutimonas halocynthiae]MDN3641339.1 prephenate dehydrogenase [Lutimonas halocynthiae]
MKKIAIIGLGLIGGSLALELKKNSWATIYGIDKNPEHVNKALELGIIYQKAGLEIIPEMDVVIIAVPVNIIPDLSVSILDHIGENTLVFDVGSTKSAVCDAIRNHKRRQNFVALHPIAGTEFSGPEAAIYDLFTDKVNIICERKLSSSTMVDRAIDIFENLKMKNVFMESATQHDTHIAYVSHLSHISSFMLGKTVLEIEKDEKNIFNMAGSGFASTVRLAKSNPETWTPIFLQNRDNLLKSLEEYIKNLNQFKDILTRKSADDVLNIMQNTNRIKDVLAGIKHE